LRSTPKEGESGNKRLQKMVFSKQQVNSAVGEDKKEDYSHIKKNRSNKVECGVHGAVAVAAVVFHHFHAFSHGQHVVAVHFHAGNHVPHGVVAGVVRVPVHRRAHAVSD